MFSVQPHVSRCCLLPPIDIQQALVQHAQCPCRFVILATKALYSQASRQVYIFASHIRGILTRVASGLFSWSAVAGLLAFSSRQYTPTINRGPLSASHCCSLLSKRSGRRMPPAERSALLIHVVGHIALYQLACCCHVTLVVGEMLSHVTM